MDEVGGASHSNDCDITMDESEVSFEGKSSVEHVKQTVDLTQVLLANQTLIKQQAELIKSMTASFAPLTELPEHEEILN